MKRTKGYTSFFLYSLATASLIAALAGCGEDPGLYEQETLNFQGQEIGNFEEDTQNIDLGAEERSDFSIWPASFIPAPLFAYYKYPVPVAVPINPFLAITEWIHPMYAVSLLQPFWPAVFAP